MTFDKQHGHIRPCVELLSCGRFLLLLQITVQTTVSSCLVRVTFILLALRQFFLTWTCVVSVDFADCFNLFCSCKHRTWRVWTPRWHFCLWAFVHLSTKNASRMDIWKELNGPTHQRCDVQLPKRCVSDYTTRKADGRKKKNHLGVKQPNGRKRLVWMYHPMWSGEIFFYAFLSRCVHLSMHLSFLFLFYQ